MENYIYPYVHIIMNIFYVLHIFSMSNDSKRSVPRNYLVLAIIVVAVLVGGIYFSSSGGGGDCVVKIGHILPMSGPLAAYAEGFQAGVQAAVNEANDQGGIDGCQIQLIEEDSGTDPTMAAAAATKLVDIDGVHAIIGVYASSSTLSAAPIVEEGQTIMISPASTSPEITNAGDYIFRTAPSDALQGAAMADLALAQGHKTAAVIFVNNQYGQGLADVFSATFESKGGSVLLQIPYELEMATYRTELSQIQAANPDIIIDVSYADDGQIIFREGHELGISSQWLGGDGIADDAIFEAPGIVEATEGMIGTRPDSPDSPGKAAFLAILQQYGFEDSGIYTREAYDAAKLAILAIDKAGVDASKDSIRDALIDVADGYVGAAGDKTFDENGDVGGAFALWRIVSGEFVDIGSWDSNGINLD